MKDEQRHSSVDQKDCNAETYEYKLSYDSIGKKMSFGKGCRMSLQSDISGKARVYFQRDLFQNLTQDFGMREENAQQQGMSLEGCEGMSVEGSVVSGTQRVSCRCPKSKCLLMYCDCFSRGMICNEDCSCYQCRNNPAFEEKRQNARRIVLERDPSAFTNKLEIVGGEESELAYKRGCNCKKTRCCKKYCECYLAAVKCTYLCNCENCVNGGHHAYKQA